jgi:hypothetical protein
MMKRIIEIKREFYEKYKDQLVMGQMAKIPALGSESHFIKQINYDKQEITFFFNSIKYGFNDIHCLGSLCISKDFMMAHIEHEKTGSPIDWKSFGLAGRPQSMGG